MKLNEKQKRFIDEYLIDLNATRAYKVAYPSCKTDKTAGVNSSRLLGNASVQEEIAKRQEDIKKRTELSQDMIINELKKIAFANATDYVEIITEENNGQHINIKDTNKLNNDKKAAISCIKNTKHGISVELYNKQEALKLLGQHLGMFKDGTNININNNIPENPYNGLSVDELKALAKECEKNGKS